jgi:hypothetical protein
MKEELIKKIEDHSKRWSSKSELTLEDLVQMHGEKCELLTEVHAFLLGI